MKDLIIKIIILCIISFLAGFTNALFKDILKVDIAWFIYTIIGYFMYFLLHFVYFE